MKILVVDDHPMVLKGMLALLGDHFPDTTLLKASSVAEAKNVILDQVPDIIFLDINLPDGNGFMLLKELKPTSDAKWMMLSTFHDAELVKESIENGAEGFLCKDADDEEILRSIESVLAGRTFFSNTVVMSLEKKPEEKPNGLLNLEDLTPAERKVLYYVTQSKTSKEIAQLLSVSYRTVENHRNNVCSKLGLYGTNALLHFAVHHKSQIEAEKNAFLGGQQGS